jgi:hypothetical protein
MEIMNALKRAEALVTDPTVKEVSLVKATAFTRRREGGMEFPDALRFMLDMNKTALQARLNKFYGQAKGGRAISQPAFTKLRANFDHTPFEIILRDLVEEEYSGKYELPTWQGLHVFAVDGSYLQLPQEPAIIKEFGVRGGEDKRGVVRAGAGASVLYDVLHGWALDPIITGCDMNERAQLEKHIAYLCGALPNIVENALILLDRGYPSHKIFALMEQEGLRFCIRCQRSFLPEVSLAPLGSSTITLKSGQSLRIVKFLLGSGETETLLTNLFDLPEDEFPALYAMRWGVETMYHKLKQIVCVEQFSGRTPNSVRQDFWASFVMLLFAVMFQKEADNEIAKRQESLPVKHLNRSRATHVIVTLRDRFIFSALCGYPLLAKLELRAVIDELARVVSPVRPGRSFPREPRVNSVANPFLKSVL